MSHVWWGWFSPSFPHLCVSIRVNGMARRPEINVVGVSWREMWRELFRCVSIADLMCMQQNLSAQQCCSLCVLLYFRSVWGIAEQSTDANSTYIWKQTCKGHLAIRHASEIHNINIIQQSKQILCRGQGTQETTDKGVGSHNPLNKMTYIWPNIIRDL